MKKNDGARTLSELFDSAGFSLNERQREQFLSYLQLIEKYNEELDLTRLRRSDDIILKHFIDSVYITKLVSLPSPLLDIGTGAGFPGIPLKIIDPSLEIILAEQRKKRIDFLKLLIKELDLEGIEIYPHKVTEKSFFEVNGIITRALESIDETLTRIHHFMPAEGKAFFMKGPEANTDIFAISEENKKSYKIESDKSYVLPGTNFYRRLLVISKIATLLRHTYRIFLNQEENIGRIITSPENRQFKDLKFIVDQSGINKKKKMIISGKKIILEAVKQSRIEPELLMLYDGYVENDPAFDLIIKQFAKRDSLLILKKNLFNELDILSNRGPLLVAKLPDIPEWNYKIESGCTLLVPFQDPSNVGSCIRSAAAFGVSKIVLLREAAHPFHPKSIRSSSGAVFNANLCRGPSIKDLAGIFNSETGLVTLDTSGRDISSFSFPENFILLPGIEGPGLPENLKKNSVSIPLSFGIESLNAAVSVSIALYDWKRKSG